MTYEGMKPMTPEVHDALADWVKQGGALVFLGDDSDPYNAVRAWWNDPEAARSYKAPRDAPVRAPGPPGRRRRACTRSARGPVLYDTASPASLTYRTDGAEHVRALVKQACGSIGLAYTETNHLTLRRGPYVVAAGLDESIGGPDAVLKGRFLDLFDAALPMVNLVTLKPGSRRLLLDLDKVPGPGPLVLASACKILGMKAETRGGFSFHAEGPDGIESVVCLRLPDAAESVKVAGQVRPRRLPGSGSPRPRHSGSGSPTRVRDAVSRSSRNGGDVANAPWSPRAYQADVVHAGRFLPLNNPSISNSLADRPRSTTAIISEERIESWGESAWPDSRSLKTTGFSKWSRASRVLNRISPASMGLGEIQYAASARKRVGGRQILRFGHAASHHLP